MTSDRETAAGLPRLRRAIHSFERVVIVVLLVMLVVLIADAVFELAWLLVRAMISPPVMRVGVDGLLELFGFFLLIIIGLELLESIKTYLQRTVIQVEIVLEIALIAIARKLIVLDVSKYGAPVLLGLAALILALAVGLLVYRRSRS